jgi:hypothetical protein
LPAVKSPVVVYSRRRYVAPLFFGAVAFGGLTVYAAFVGEHGYLATGLIGLLFVVVSGYGVRSRLVGSVALTCRDGFLVGGELREPVPVAGTTFEIKSDYYGSWLILLHHDGQEVRLGAGGWRVEDGRRVTREVAERILLALGLTPHLS